MIRFNARNGNQRVVGVGITQGTYQDMMAGEVLTVDLAPLGVPDVSLILIAGRDELTITRSLQTHIGERTRIHVDPSAVIQRPRAG